MAVHLLVLTLHSKGLSGSKPGKCTPHHNRNFILSDTCRSLLSPQPPFSQSVQVVYVAVYYRFHLLKITFRKIQSFELKAFGKTYQKGNNNYASGDDFIAETTGM
jgi:hypothetical protein